MLVDTTKKAPRPEREHYTIMSRDSSLRDLPNKLLFSLTKLLRMPPTGPNEAWLSEQDLGVAKLDHSLRIPNNPLTRAAIRGGAMGLTFCPKGAHLCGVHENLDPRIVRNLNLLLQNEFNKILEVRGRCQAAYHPDVEKWLVRIDTVRKLWNIRCEACVCAAIGGREHILLDIRASIFARRNLCQCHTGGTRDILRVIEAWMKPLPRALRWQLRKESEVLAGAVSGAMVMASMQAKTEDKAKKKVDEDYKRAEMEGGRVYTAYTPEKTMEWEVATMQIHDIRHTARRPLNTIPRKPVPVHYSNEGESYNSISQLDSFQDDDDDEWCSVSVYTNSPGNSPTMKYTPATSSVYDGTPGFPDSETLHKRRGSAFKPRGLGLFI